MNLNFLIKQKMDHKEVTFFKGIESLEKSHFAIIKNNFTIVMIIRILVTIIIKISGYLR